MKTSKIRSFRKTLRKFERLNQLMNSTCCKGVTMAQCHALLEIEEGVETTTIQLANKLMLDKSTLSRTVDALANLGLVQRNPHPTDRRFTLLVLTEKGERLCEEINKENDRLYAQIFLKLPETIHNKIIKDFELLVQAMTECHQNVIGDEGCCN